MAKVEIRGYNMTMARRLQGEAKDKAKAKNKTISADELKKIAEPAKGRLMNHVMIERDGNRCTARGHDVEFQDDRITVIMTVDKAKEAIAAKVAKAGDGWDDEE